MSYLVTPEETQEVLLVRIRQGFVECASPRVEDRHMHEDEADLCCLALLQLLLQPLAFRLIEAGFGRCIQDNKISLADLKGVIRRPEDLLIIMRRATIKVVIADGGENGDRKVPLHLREEASIMTQRSSVNQVTIVKDKRDIFITAYISQQRLKHRTVSLVVTHDSKAIVVRIGNGKPREFFLVPVVGGHRCRGMPYLDPDECEDTQRGHDYLDGVFFKCLFLFCNQSSHLSAFLSEFVYSYNLI